LVSVKRPCVEQSSPGQTEGLKVGCGGMGGWVRLRNGWMGGWVGGWVGFINILVMYNKAVGQG
jgi:hypothetical protein